MKEIRNLQLHHFPEERGEGDEDYKHTMRTRSSRLFFVLLHLVSVSTDIIHIGGVYNPQAIVLQRMQWTSADGLHGILIQHLQQQQQQQQQQLPLTLEDPFWLQVSYSDCVFLYLFVTVMSGLVLSNSKNTQTLSLPRP